MRTAGSLSPLQQYVSGMLGLRRSGLEVAKEMFCNLDKASVCQITIPEASPWPLGYKIMDESYFSCKKMKTTLSLWRRVFQWKIGLLWESVQTYMQDSIDFYSRHIVISEDINDIINFYTVVWVSKTKLFSIPCSLRTFNIQFVFVINISIIVLHCNMFSIKFIHVVLYHSVGLL